MKTTYTAWAVQVLRDGEWEVLQPLWRSLCDTRRDARLEAAWLRHGPSETKAKACKVRVTVEEV